MKLITSKLLYLFIISTTFWSYSTLAQKLTRADIIADSTMFFELVDFEKSISVVEHIYEMGRAKSLLKKDYCNFFYLIEKRGCVGHQRIVSAVIGYDSKNVEYIVSESSKFEKKNLQYMNEDEALNFIELTTGVKRKKMFVQESSVKSCTKLLLINISSNNLEYGIYTDEDFVAGEQNNFPDNQFKEVYLYILTFIL